MALQQPPWHSPPHQVDQPVLKIFNSLTKTKVCYLNSHFKVDLLTANRPNLFPAMAPMSNGITVVQQYMMRLTWAMRGQDFSLVNVLQFLTLFEPEIMLHKTFYEES
jgi:hypothetical protein